MTTTIISIKVSGTTMKEHQGLLPKRTPGLLLRVTCICVWNYSTYGYGHVYYEAQKLLPRVEKSSLGLNGIMFTFKFKVSIKLAIIFNKRGDRTTKQKYTSPSLRKRPPSLNISY